MKPAQIREMTADEIRVQLASTRRELLDLQVKEAAKTAGRAPVKVRNLRHDVARLETILREKETAL